MPELSVQDAAPATVPNAGLPRRVRAPAIWQTLLRGIDPEGAVSRPQRRLGDVFTIRLLGLDVVVLGNPDAVKEVFSHGAQDLNTGEANEPFKPIFGTSNLLLLDGDEHLSRRKLVLPSFHGERLRAYENLMREMTRQELSTWPIGKPMAAVPRMQSLTYSIILRCIFGLHDGERERVQALAVSVQELVRWIANPRHALTYFLRGPDRLMQMDGYRRRREDMDGQIRAMIAERRSAPDLDERDDILSTLIAARDEDGRPLPDAGLLDELVTLLIVGHATSAGLMAWAIHELARDPASQERIATEEGPFLDAVITETLRLRPPLTGVVRRLRKPLSVAGYQLPAGATVMCSQQLVQRRADLYPDPWSFKPERFLDRRPVPSEWFPFGGSIRRCIGASFAQFQARVILEEITKTLRLAPARARPEAPKHHLLILVPARGARVIATPR
jgi:cytochrome P450 family 135